MKNKDVYFKQAQSLSGQYLAQSLLEYWVHTLSLVLSVKPAPAVSLHSVTMTAGCSTLHYSAGTVYPHPAPSTRFLRLQ